MDGRILILGHSVRTEGLNGMRTVNRGIHLCFTATSTSSNREKRPSQARIKRISAAKRADPLKAQINIKTRRLNLAVCKCNAAFAPTHRVSIEIMHRELQRALRQMNEDTAATTLLASFQFR